MIRIARLSTSARSSAAAAAVATSPRAALAAARRAPRASASTSAPASPLAASQPGTVTSTVTSAAPPAVKRVRATRARVAPVPAPDPELDAEPDIDFLPTQGIQDYAALQPPSSPAPRRVSPTRAPSVGPMPTASPPLTSLPGAGYEPLPSIPQGGSSASVATLDAAAPGTAPWSPSHPGQLGAKTLEDGYVFRIPGEAVEDWTTSFRGLSAAPFPKDVAEALLRPLKAEDVEMKPDGLLYLPEIKYRRTLNQAFGPGGWGLAPRGETHIGPRIVSREWGLVCLGRLVAIARGEQEYFDPSGIPTATEACKSNALMRCCKDLGIASELWDPRFIREFKAKHCVEAMVEHVTQKKKRKLWRRKDQKFEYPYKEISVVAK
ncbi:hypothetical protein CcaverHIS002_0702550 [Cutaneotrichosporon cavernicola]|uniref:Mitochondrial genome maintenance protein MGM101 n=1 Tax=Cutaneotrichosporon cavernicola TaxID=279322 RepID=A0AA48QYL9_9TREE|nr:uncharacterized protein CcaverHIS019_0702630 [Cutaneotrichosporon cavernicola]BEI86909.1 hypothetical protein CcaverHIS002_0702550 [Cutaneotrichosporon cavernicola]BEI94682.1 hypothetical protein CcaverHIS019_0702630 [Cutaneotrichosporon cavernicola]BEJ02457.1 hypothetical protein CcaverHIS631_0702520 [Cutaneotrichosporon cavernicola]BEJ10216.1 hypothetical protein CcaverHIS641_0702510 [Cutaneotrichosporon cavernicola]